MLSVLDTVAKYIVQSFFFFRLPNIFHNRWVMIPFCGEILHLPVISWLSECTECLIVELHPMKSQPGFF